MNDGPTTVGSIVGKLKIDSSEWDRDLDRAYAKATGLKNADPTIKVDAQVDKALAKLAAVDAAQAKLGLSTDRLKLARQRLEEIQASGIVKQSTLMAAHLAAARAENAHEKATRDLTSAQRALVDIMDEEGEQTQRTNSANRDRLSHFQRMAILIASLVPLMGPLGAYVAGVGGGLLGMGAAGVLAIVGIKRAMEQGNETGQQYRAGIRQLKDDMGELSDTAAVGMLGFFRQAVSQITAAMPMLNGQVTVFSRLLGSSGNYLLSGVINALRILNPLFVTAAVYVQNLAAGFDTWTRNGGLQTFADYALENLPRVADTLGNLATLALHLIEALSPLGIAALGVLSGISQGLNAVPVDVLGVLITLGGGAVIAFRAWAFISPMLVGIATSMGQVGIATGLVSGPVGVAVTLIGALAAIALYAAGASQRAAAAQQNYTAAIEADTGAIAENVRMAAAKALLDEGAYDLANQLGVSTKLVTEATLGNADALKTLTAELEYGTAGSQRLKDRMDDTGLGMLDLSNKSNDLLGIITQQSGGVQGAAADYKTLKSVLAETENAQSDAGDEIDATTQKMIDQNDAAGILVQAFDILNGKTLDVYSAATAFNIGLLDVTETLLKNGTGLDSNTRAGLENQAMIQSQIERAQRHAIAISGGTELTEAGTAAYVADMQAIRDHVDAVGGDTSAIQALIDVIGQVPPTKKTQFEMDTDAALAKLDALKAALASVPSWQRTSIGVDSSGVPDWMRQPAKHADGGTVGGFGTSRSDSNVVRLSRGEEVVRAAAASSPGVRPLLKAINANPSQAMDALAGSGGGVHFAQLDPRLMRYLEKAADRPVVVIIGDDQIADAAMRGTSDGAAQGKW